MAYATLAGQALPVDRNGATELAPEVIGARLRTYNASRRSTIRAEKRGWQFRLTPMLPTVAATLKAAIALGAQVVLAGDVVDGVNVTVDCELQDAPMMTGSGSPVGFYRILIIRCFEV